MGSEMCIRDRVNAFQKAYPDVRVQILITERIIDHVEEGVDLLFRIGALRDSSLVARKILTYRHRLLASPAYLKTHKPPRSPQELLQHRLIAFSRWMPENRWYFIHAIKKESMTLRFQPYLSINDYAAIAPALVAGMGIGELPPIVRSELLNERKLIEVMPNWHLRTFDMWLLHAGNRHLPRSVGVFKEFAARMVPELFPNLPA